MKPTIIVTILLSLCVGCSTRPSDQLNQQQADQVKEEIKVILDSIMVGVNGNQKIQYYLDSPDFLGFNLDGSQADIQTVKRSVQWFADSVVVYKLQSADRFPVVMKDVVVYVWSGPEELGLKSVDTIKYHPRVVTYVFKKLEGRWKIVYVQESGTKTIEKLAKK